MNKKAPTNERRVGIRELKSRLSECVRDVKSGATIVVTEHGRSVARLVPDAGSVDDRLDVLKASGAVQWSGRRLTRLVGAPRTKGARTVAAILLEDRG